MHDGMQCDPIQGQDRGRDPLKLGNSAILLKAISFPFYNGVWQMTGFLNYGTIPKAYRGRIFIFVLVFVSRDFEVGSK